MNFDSIISGMIYCAPNEVEGRAEWELGGAKKGVEMKHFKNPALKGLFKKDQNSIRILFILPEVGRLPTKTIFIILFLCQIVLQRVQASKLQGVPKKVWFVIKCS